MSQVEQVLPDRLPVPLLDDVRALIDTTRHQTATAVNMGLTLLYWRIGRRIGEDVLGGERGAYGEPIVAALRRQLVGGHGQGLGVSFAKANHKQIVYALSRQSNWTKRRSIKYLTNNISLGLCVLV